MLSTSASPPFRGNSQPPYVNSALPASPWRVRPVHYTITARVLSNPASLPLAAGRFFHAWHSHGIAENECAVPPQPPGPQGFESKWHRWHSTFCNIGIYIITLRGKRYAFLLCHLCHFPCNRWAPALSRGIAETVFTVPQLCHLCHFPGRHAWAVSAATSGSHSAGPCASIRPACPAPSRSAPRSSP